MRKFYAALASTCALGALAAPASADGVKDYALNGAQWNVGYIGSYGNVGDRCDITVKQIGGPTSAVQAWLYSYARGGVANWGWSPWLHVNEQFTWVTNEPLSPNGNWVTDYGVQWRTAQSNLGATVRIRATGPCFPY